MLFTDGPSIGAADLTALDPSVPSVSSSSNIPLTGPGGVILQAWTELGHELLAWMASITGDFYTYPGLILTNGVYGSNRSRYLLNQVITTAQWGGILSPLSLYAARKALTLFWSLAVRSSKAADRFEKKWEMAQTEERCAKRRVWSAGIPINLNPLSCPGALYDDVPAGAWTLANVSGASGGTLAAPESFDVAITWVDQSTYISPTASWNGESGPSSTVTLLLEAGQALAVSIASLIPPGKASYQGGIADGVRYARNASGWNVYANLSGQDPVLQNAAPIALNVQTFTAATIALSGNLLGTGQAPDFNQRPTHTLSRA